MIYVNVLPDILSPNSKIYLYADDAKIYRRISSSQDRLILQDDINRSTKWTDEWLITLNINKCKIVSYGRNIDFNKTYYINNVPLEEINIIKDLGVTFDSHLKFQLHIDEKVNNAYYFLGIVRRNFKFLSKDTFIILYKSLVRSHLEYAVQVWSTVMYKKKIEKVQMRATKLIHSMKNLTYSERLKHLNLPTLHYRRICGDMIMVFKIITNKIDSSVSDDFIQSLSATRGNRYKIIQKHVHFNLTKYSISTFEVNNLPLFSIKNLSSSHLLYIQCLSTTSYFSSANMGLG